MQILKSIELGAVVGDGVNCYKCECFCGFSNGTSSYIGTIDNVQPACTDSERPPCRVAFGNDCEHLGFSRSYTSEINAGLCKSFWLGVGIASAITLSSIACCVVASYWSIRKSYGK